MRDHRAGRRDVTALAAATTGIATAGLALLALAAHVRQRVGEEDDDRADQDDQPEDAVGGLFRHRRETTASTRAHRARPHR